MLEVVEKHPYQFVLGKPVRALESKPSPPSDEIDDFLASLCLISINFRTPPRLWVLQN